MILALTKDAEKQTAAKKYAEATAALEYAHTLSEGLGLFTKAIDEQLAMVATMSGKAPAVPLDAGVAVVKPVDQTTPAALPKPPDGLGLKAPVIPVVVQADSKQPLISPDLAAKPEAAPAPRPAAAPKVDLIAQAAAEMKRGDLGMARKIALQAHNDPACKVQAQALLRQIDAEETAVKQRNARTAFENGMASYQAKRYENAIGVFVLIDPTLLSEDQQKSLRKAMDDCQAKAAPIAPVAGEAPGVAKLGPTTAPQKPAMESVAEQKKALNDVAFQKLRQDGFEALNAANAAWGRGETDAAIQTLTDYEAKVRASSQTPSQQGLLLRPIEQRVENYRLLKHHTDFIAKEAKDKADFRREMVASNVAETQKQDEVKRKVKQVAEFTKAGKFKEAELAAAQAKQLDPDDPSLTLIFEQAKMRHRVEDFKQIRESQEKLFREGLNEVEKEGEVTTTDRPVIINPEMARRAAARGTDVYLRTRTPDEMRIDHQLGKPFSFKYEGQSLRTIIQDIARKTKLNIVTDDAAIDDEKIELDKVTVTEEVNELPLRDALTILLAKARLSHVVENNVVKVTTEKKSRGRMVTKVFHVMDLVTPIPEYRPASYERLDTAMEASSGMLRNALQQLPGATPGGASPQIPHSGLQQGEMVSTGRPGGSTPFLSSGGTMQNDMQPRPTAMAPQRSQYAEQLKRMITKLVRPYAWQDLGGPGQLEYYDIGGALVVNQTADVIGEVNDLLEALRRLQDLSVSVEIRVISLSETFFERVGVDFSMNILTHNNTFEQQLATSQFTPEPFLNTIRTNNVIVGYNPAQGGFTPDLAVPIRSTSYGLTMPPFGGYQQALSPTNNGGISLGLAFLNDIQVYMFMEAAQGNQRVNIMQAPKVTLFNGQTATVFVGDVAYFTTGLAVFNVGGQMVYFPQNTAFPVGPGIDPNSGNRGGVSVTVQAVVSADRRFVRMNMSPTLTALASATVPLFPVSTFITPVFEGGSQGQPVPFTQFFQQPSFTNITAQTTVAVPDGGTVLLGGLKSLAQGRNEYGPPVISQIPYLNRLFKNVGVGQETRHVMIMVTPRIIINSEEEARQVGEGGGLLPPQQ
jgi:type II secretory pathway component GspD/PulD (secretin)